MFLKKPSYCEIMYSVLFHYLMRNLLHDKFWVAAFLIRNRCLKTFVFSILQQEFMQGIINLNYYYFHFHS